MACWFKKKEVRKKFRPRVVFDGVCYALEVTPGQFLDMKNCSYTWGLGNDYFNNCWIKDKTKVESLLRRIQLITDNP